MIASYALQTLHTVNNLKILEMKVIRMANKYNNATEAMFFRKESLLFCLVLFHFNLF
jgi:hypothetical protein